jgi:hypothetical protein
MRPDEIYVSQQIAAADGRSAAAAAAAAAARGRTNARDVRVMTNETRAPARGTGRS